MIPAGVTIDAGVLAIPAVEGSSDDTHRYVEALLNWAVLVGEAGISINMSELAREALCQDNLYPFRNQLQALFTAHGVIQYAPNDVARLVERLFHTPSFEVGFAIQDALFDNFVTDPDILCLCSDRRLVAHLERSLVLIAVLRKHCHDWVHEHPLILRSAPCRTVRVLAQIDYIEHTRTDLVLPTGQPSHLEGDVVVCDDLSGLLRCFDEAALLLEATDELVLGTVIRLGVFKRRESSGLAPVWDDCPPHRVGHEFLMSLLGKHPKKQLAKKLVRAIVETVEEIQMADTHVLRTGSGANDPQRVRSRDQAKAWRRDIDRDYHLHYWKCVDGSVEIASVSYPHDDLTIPE